MGWTQLHRYRGYSHKEFFGQEFNSSTCGQVLAAAGSLHEVYLAYEKPDGQVFGIVCLIHWSPKERDGFNFRYKEMTEDMGPCACNCPAKILDLLTDPPSNAWAAEWRARCRANLAKKTMMSKIKVTIGTEFTYSKKRYVIVGHSWRRNWLVKNLDNGFNYTIKSSYVRQALAEEVA